MLEIALSCNISYSEFWQMTPFEISIAMKVFNKKEKDKYNLGVILAFKTAYFGRLEKLSGRDLEKHLINDEIKSEQMTDEQMAINMQNIALIFGGG